MKLLKNGNIVIEKDKDAFREILYWSYCRWQHNKYFLEKWSSREIEFFSYHELVSDKNTMIVNCKLAPKARPKYRIKKRRAHYQALTDKFSELGSLYEFLYK